jgi:hypothetical protein
MLKALIPIRQQISFLLTWILLLNVVTPAILMAGAPSDFRKPSYWNTTKKGKSYYNNSNILASTPVADNAPPKIAMPLLTDIADITTVAQTENNRPTTNKKVPDIGGPSQPEMTGFTPMGANDMVDLFSGDFSYNIPLVDIGGYPVNLGYSGNINAEQEASWAGLGWNVSVGNVGRVVRGLPDDFNGESIIKEQRIKDNITYSVDVGGKFEIFGKDKKKPSSKDTKENPDSTIRKASTFSLSTGVFYNTYKGWGISTKKAVGINQGGNGNGKYTAEVSVINNSQNGASLGADISLNVNLRKKEGIFSTLTPSLSFNSREGIEALQINSQTLRTRNYTNLMKKSTRENGVYGNFGTFGVSMDFTKSVFVPSIQMPYTTSSFRATFVAGAEISGLHPNTTINYTKIKQYIKKEDQTQIRSAYGYMHLQEANQNPDALLDVSKDKDLPFNQNSKIVNVPMYNYDVFNITGQGVGGNFRAYRGEVGYGYNNRMVSKSNNQSYGLDIGAGKLFHGGLDITLGFNKTEDKVWEGGNLIADKLKFGSNNLLTENMYFKNPGEKTRVNETFLNDVNDEDLMHPNIDNFYAPVARRYYDVYNTSGERYKRQEVVGNLQRGIREKRTQVITYLNASDATILGLDKTIKYYNPGEYPGLACTNSVRTMSRVSTTRKENHISEITVLNEGGSRYVYGLPAYNLNQQEVSFSSIPGNAVTGLVTYDPGMNTLETNKRVANTDEYFSREITPQHAHSYLLTALLSPDYVDVTGDGVSDDDMGDGVKFNYTRLYSDSGNNSFKWKAPYGDRQANYSKGINSDGRDDKASYTYGEKEVWYLNSIESKNMIGIFITSTKKDVMAVKDTDGTPDSTKKLQKLEEIRVYSKTDFLKYGINVAKPFKTVKFTYDSILCPGVPSSSYVNQGKLTLRKVAFYYNKNNKTERNVFLFNYGNNPTYKPNTSDRWGTYKDATATNPIDGSTRLPNAEFPYTIQRDSVLAAQNASAWMLNEIKLPSGSKINITYESDDYGFVQDKKAMEMMKIAGFGPTVSSTPVNSLYSTSFLTINDYDYVFIDVPKPIVGANAKAQIKELYLANNDEIVYMKLMVKVLGDIWGSGAELVPMYLPLTDYGVVAGNTSRIWLQIKRLKVTPLLVGSGILANVFQYFRNNLHSKALPGSEPGNDLTFKAMANVIIARIKNFTNIFNSFYRSTANAGRFNEVVVNHSMVRLCNPELKKYGGGHRVKKVEIIDNWSAMTKLGPDSLKASVYGQVYNYTTTELVNGKQQTISSGVATYEPMLGNDENPFRQPVDRAFRVSSNHILGPKEYSYEEDPVAESFYPSASVGYSKVTVTPLNTNRKSSNGKSITEYYTSRDFPTQVSYTNLRKGRNLLRLKTPGINVLFGLNIDLMTVAQGVKVTLNDMQGKVKTQAIYAQNGTDRVSFTQNYYKLNNPNSTTGKTLNNDVLFVNAKGVITKGVMGKEVEVFNDFNHTKNTSASGRIGIDVDVDFPTPPFVKLGLGFNGSIGKEVFKSATTTKIVNKYGILDSVVVTDKGSVVTTQNLLYDEESGNVVVTRTNNEFKQPIYNVNFPAHWAYKGMEGAYKNIGFVYNGSITKSIPCINGRLKTELITHGFMADSIFESGDELYVKATEESYFNAMTDPCTLLLSTTNSNVKAQRLWVIDAAKAKEGAPGLYLIDKNGKLFSGRLTYIKIIRSGKRNLLGASVGSIMLMKNPIVTTGLTTSLKIDSTMQILNASSQIFKDCWPIDNRLKEVDSCILVPRTATATVNFTELVTQRANALHIKIWGQNFQNFNQLPSSNNPVNYIAAGVRRFNSGINTRVYNYVRTRYKVDFNIPEGTTIDSARANFYAAAPTQLFDFGNYQNPNYTANYNGPVIGGSFYDPTTVLKAYPINLINAGFKWDHNFANLGSNSIVFPHIGGVEATQNYLNRDATAFINDLKNRPANLRYVNYRMPIEENNNSRLEYSKHFTFSSCLNTSKEVSYAPACDCATSCPKITIYYTVYDTVCYKKCVSVLAGKDTINPYIYGVYGNWRPEKSLVYYGERKESLTTTATNIKTDGTIKSFVPYWQFVTNKLSAVEDTTRWVWNMKMNLVNRLGADIENVDPLNRYNAAVYGYRQHLPIAVGQNTRNRDLIFDGFEDYDYKTDACNTCVKTGIVNLNAATGSALSTEQAHTGKTAVKLNTNSTVSIPIAIKDTGSLAVQTCISMKQDTFYKNYSYINGKGNGLTGTYFYVTNTSVNYAISGIGGLEDFNNQTPPLTPNTGINMVATGHIQAKTTGRHYFKITTTNGVLYPVIGGVFIASTPYFDFVAGQLYPITIYYYSTSYLGPNVNLGSYNLQWYSSQQTLESVPLTALYSPADYNLSATSIVNVTDTCYVQKNPKPLNLINAGFEPVAGQKMVLSYWVREGTVCATDYPNNGISILKNGVTPIVPVLNDKSLIIEGWQRKEYFFDIPIDATQVTLNFTSGASTAYLDDIRMHPFNANMKSFVYDPVNLRLVAELDENNYSSFYEYDNDGTLIRTKKETARGIKTITETRSGLTNIIQ